MGTGQTRMLGERAATALAPVLAVFPGSGFHGPNRLHPVFIVGSGRSGTTLLRRMLMEGRQIHIPPESYVLGTVIRKFAVWRLLPWRWTVRRVLSEFERYPEFDRFDISLRPVEATLEVLPAASRTLATIIDAIYRHHSIEKGIATTRWGDKTPHNSYFLPEIHRVFPRGQFVHVLRDGCDVVSSMLEMGRYATIEQAAERWNSSLEAIHRFTGTHPDSIFEIRYEELATDPEATLRTVCEWLELDYRAEMVTSVGSAGNMGDVPSRAHHRNVLEPITTKSVGRGRRSLDESSSRQLERLIGATLESSGYPPASAPAPSGDREPT